MSSVSVGGFGVVAWALLGRAFSGWDFRALFALLGGACCILIAAGLAVVCAILRVKVPFITHRRFVAVGRVASSLGRFVAVNSFLMSGSFASSLFLLMVVLGSRFATSRSTFPAIFPGGSLSRRIPWLCQLLWLPLFTVRRRTASGERCRAPE